MAALSRIIRLVDPLEDVRQPLWNFDSMGAKFAIHRDHKRVKLLDAKQARRFATRDSTDRSLCHHRFFRNAPSSHHGFAACAMELPSTKTGAVFLHNDSRPFLCGVSGINRARFNCSSCVLLIVELSFRSASLSLAMILRMLAGVPSVSVSADGFRRSGVH